MGTISKQLNILLINKYYWRKGGSEAVFFSEKSLLENADHKVIPFSMKSENNKASEYSEYFVDEVDYNKEGVANKLSSGMKIIYSFEAKNKMNDLLQKVSPDIAHFHIFQHQISPSVFGPLKKKNIPLILTLHDLKPICPNYKFYVNGHVCEACMGGKFYNCYKNKCTKGSSLASLINTVEMYFHSAMGYYRSVDRFIAVSKFYKRKMIEAGFPPLQISYLPNFIDVNDYSAENVDKGYMLYIGRLSEEKGIETYINSAAENRKIPFYIAGTGPLEEKLKRKAHNANLDNVKFLGFVKGEELKTLIAESTCVVVPSEWYENCPMAVLEAFASGKPVIGANIGGIPELINNSIDGFTFEPGNTNELSSKIDWVWANRDKAALMGAEGRRKIELNFNSKKHYQELMNIYHSVLGK